MPAQELSTDPIFGRRGPTQDGMLYKKSDSGELRPRYFQLKDRRLMFWADGDAVNIVDGHLRARGQVGSDQHDRIVATTPKGWRDIIGATIRTIETCCDGPDGPRTNWYGVEIVEEYGVKLGADRQIVKACAERGRGPSRILPRSSCCRPLRRRGSFGNLAVRAGDFGANSPLYRPGEATQLFHYEVEARDMWMDALIVATRPAWVLDGDPRAVSKWHASVLASDIANRRRLDSLLSVGLVVGAGRMHGRKWQVLVHGSATPLSKVWRGFSSRGPREHGAARPVLRY